MGAGRGVRERTQGVVMTMSGGEGAWHDVEPMRDTLRTGVGAPGLCGLHSNGEAERRGGQRAGGQARGDDGGVAGRTATALARHPLCARLVCRQPSTARPVTTIVSAAHGLVAPVPLRRLSAWGGDESRRRRRVEGAASSRVEGW